MALRRPDMGVGGSGPAPACTPRAAGNHPKARGAVRAEASIASQEKDAAALAKGGGMPGGRDRRLRAVFAGSGDPAKEV